MSVSANEEFSHYVCRMCPEALQRARQELHEDPDTRLLEASTFKQRLQKVPGLNPRKDIRFLLLFLRARKFDQERAYQLALNYFKVKVDRPDIFGDLTPSKVKGLMDAGVFEVLDKRDMFDCKVLIIRLGKWDPNHHPMLELFRGIVLVTTKMVEDEDTQVYGLALIIDMADVTLRHAREVTPSLARMGMQLMQDVAPIRLKRLSFVHEPIFFDLLFTVMKPFIKNKLMGRINLLGKKTEKLQLYSDPDSLPEDLGGNMKPFSNQAWNDSFMASETQFFEDNAFGFEDKKSSK